MVGFFGQGPGSVIREFAGIKTQPVICYEVLFPNFVRDAVAAGAEVIFNFTNDSWFGPVGAPYYHLNLASFRSIESRVPQFRTTNTGFSALILPDGEIVQRSALYAPEIMTSDVPVIEPIPTLMLAWGDWFGRTAFALSSLLLAIAHLSAFKRREKARPGVAAARPASRR
jgi:apolipoprotein N-acyltransferase